MKGFGHVGQGGGPFSSSSNLSPLAPPFTVDPSHPRPRTNSFGHLTDPHFTEIPPPYSFGVGPPQHENWLQLHPSSSIPNSFPASDPIHATGLSSGSVAAYDNLNLNFFGAQSVTQSYLPPYPSASIHDNITSMSINEQNSMLPKSGVAPLAPGGGLWSGMSGGEQWRRNDTNITGPLAYNNLVNQGIPWDDALPACEERPNVWLGRSVESFARKSHIESKGTDFLNSKSSSTSEESTEAISFHMARKSKLVGTSEVDPFSTSRASKMSNPRAPSKMSYPQAPSPDLLAELWSQVNSKTDSCEHLKEVDPYATDPMLFYPSTTNTIHKYSSPTIGSSSNSKLYKEALSSNANPLVQPRGAFDDKGKSAGRTRSDTVFILGNSEERGHVATSKTDSGIKGCSLVPLNSPPKAKDVLSNHNPITDDSFNHFFKAKSKLHHNLSLAPVSAARDGSIGNSSEMPDQFNYSEDSPCWRGASGSGYAMFGVEVAETVKQPQICHVNGEAVTVSSPKQNMNLVYQEMGHGLDGSSSSPKQPSSVDGLSPTETAARNLNAGSDHSQMYNKDTISDGSNSDSGLEVPKMEKGSLALDDGTATLRPLRSDGIVAASEMDGSSHMSNGAGEYVSTLPCSRCSLPTALPNPFPGASDTLAESQLPGIDVHLLVKVIHNLSELLVSCCSKNVDGLKGQECKVIQNVVNNLDACISKDFGSTISMTNLHKVSTAGWSQETNIKVNDVGSGCNFQNAYEGKKKLVKLGKDPEQDDPMAQAIKKIMNESFQEEEESHPQISLYKNLWLETEAALCCMKYKARFAAMNIKMDKQYKQKDLAGRAVGVEENEEKSNHYGDASKPIETESRGSNKHGDSIMARFHILKSRVENSAETSWRAQKLSKKPQVVDVSYAKSRKQWPYMNVGSQERCLGVDVVNGCQDDGVMQPAALAQGGGGGSSSSSSSSEWEHILT